MQLDLKSRAASGVYIYLVLWLLVAVWANIYQHNPTLFAVNTGLLILTASTRYYLIQYYKPSSIKQADFLDRAICVLILLSALHWGVTSSWLIYSDQYHESRWPVLIILAAIAAGGVAMLNIFRFLGALYPIFIVLPTAIVGLFFYSEHYYLLVSLGILMIIYLVHLCKTVSQSYLNKLHKHQAMYEHAQAMQSLSTIDPVTSLDNRLSFSEQFKSIWQHSLEREQAVSLLYIDLDYFKKINDEYGHAAGDACLIAVGNTLKATINREDYVVARYGGEEFTILMPNATLAMAKTVADQLNEAVRNMVFTWENQTIRVSCSIGIASLTPSIKTERIALIEMADKALYQAKSAGRDRNLVYDQAF